MINDTTKNRKALLLTVLAGLFTLSKFLFGLLFSALKLCVSGVVYFFNLLANDIKEILDYAGYGDFDDDHLIDDRDENRLFDASDIYYDLDNLHNVPDQYDGGHYILGCPPPD